MTINIRSAGPAPFSAAARQATHRAREARRRQHVITFVVLVAAARTAVDRRTLAGVIVLAVGLVAASRLAKELSMRGLDWYLGAGRSWLTDTLDSATGLEPRARSNPGSAPSPATDNPMRHRPTGRLEQGPPGRYSRDAGARGRGR